MKRKAKIAIISATLSSCVLAVAGRADETPAPVLPSLSARARLACYVDHFTSADAEVIAAKPIKIEVPIAAGDAGEGLVRYEDGSGQYAATIFETAHLEVGLQGATMTSISLREEPTHESARLVWMLTETDDVSPL